ncbi:unnamed protein product, partial [Laminaria digitata]
MNHAEDGTVNVRTNRCLHPSCKMRPNLNVDGSKTPAYCKQLDGMTPVIKRRCSHDSCANTTNFNTEGSRAGMYCKKHAENGMVDVVSRRCSRGPSSGCGRAADGIVNARRRWCSHKSCPRPPRSNVGGTQTARYCNQHAENVAAKAVYVYCCYHDSCTRRSRFNFEGSKTATPCEQH